MYTVDVCPKGKTTGCRRIGYTDVDPTPVNIELHSIYQTNVDYTNAIIAPPTTVAPDPSATASVSYYTSNAQEIVSSELVVLPVVLPIPPGGVPPPPPPPVGGEPEVPPPEDPPPDDGPLETLSLPQASEFTEASSPAATSDHSTSADLDLSSRSEVTGTTQASTTQGGTTQAGTTQASTTKGAFCTKPTPVPQSPPASAITPTSVEFQDPTDTGTPDCDHGADVSMVSIDPETLNTLAGSFCKDGMGSTEVTLDGSSLDPPADLGGVQVYFSYNESTGNCPTSCKDSMAEIVSTCELMLGYLR